MRTRVQGRIDIESVVRQIECEIKSYSRAVKIIMELDEVNYKEAKSKLERRLLFKNL